MVFHIFDFVDGNGCNDFERWSRSLQKKERAKLRSRISYLENNGEDIRPLMLADTNVAGILKLKVHGSVQLRPLLCKGPLDKNNEFTMLLGAVERGSKYVPGNAPEIADSRKSVVANDQTRRTKHVPVA